jgi:hypothetical protein
MAGSGTRCRRVVNGGSELLIFVPRAAQGPDVAGWIWRHLTCLQGCLGLVRPELSIAQLEITHVSSVS